MAPELFAACPRGLEAALAAELAVLGARDCRAVAAGVLFDGDREVAYRANLWSRLASRVLRRVAQRRYRDDDDLYRLALGAEWERFFDAGHSLRVDVSAVCQGHFNFPHLRHSKFPHPVGNRCRRETERDRP